MKGWSGTCSGLLGYSDITKRMEGSWPFHALCSDPVYQAHLKAEEEESQAHKADTEQGKQELPDRGRRQPDIHGLARHSPAQFEKGAANHNEHEPSDDDEHIHGFTPSCPNPQYPGEDQVCQDVVSQVKQHGRIQTVIPHEQPPREEPPYEHVKA